MDLTSVPGLQLLAFSAAPGSPSHDGLRLLATWAATAEREPARVDPGRARGDAVGSEHPTTDIGEEPRTQVNDSRLRVGMIGLNVEGNGWAAEAHAPAVQAVRGLDLAAVATRKQESADSAAARFGIPKAYGDPLRLIADPDIDVVAVVSPVPTHRELLLAALDARKHVLTEWPVAVGSGEITELAEAARAADVKTAVNLQARRSPSAVRAVELVGAGALGRVLSVNVLSTTAGFGATIQAAQLCLEQPDTWMNLRTIQTAHTLDLAIAVAGPLHDLQPLLDVQYPSLVVEGRDEPVARTLADHVLLNARFVEGGTLSAEIIGGRPPHDTPFRMEVVGERGALLLTGGGVRGFQASRLRLEVDGNESDLPVDGLEDLPDPVVNVAHVYAALRDDVRDGTSSAPTFVQAVDLAHLLDEIERLPAAHA